MDKANSVVEVFTGYMIFAFMALLFLQVLMRFIFKHPIYGIDECVTALMIWSMCLGWCTVYWDNGHAVLEFIMNRMPKAFRRGMFTFTNFLIVVISWVYIPASWQLFQMQKKMPPVGGLPISKGYYYALPVLVMGVIMLVMSAYKAIAFVITGDESICVPGHQKGTTAMPDDLVKRRTSFRMDGWNLRRDIPGIPDNRLRLLYEECSRESGEVPKE